MAFVLANSAAGQYLCVSADTKPPAGVRTGALAYETDTGNTFIFTGAAWSAYTSPGRDFTILNIGGGTYDPTLTMTVRQVDNGDFTAIKILSLNELVSLNIGRSGFQATNGFLIDSPAAQFTGYQQMVEVTAPSAPAANGCRFYAEDNGGGKTRLMALFNTGAAQQMAIQP